MAHKILRLPAVQNLTGLCRSSIFRRAKEGTFPKQLTLGEGGRAIGWVETEVNDWILQQIAARDSSGRAT